MSRRSLIVALFAVLAAAQIGVPLQMIVARERTLRLGKPYRFRTAPVDPYDAFRGRYVAINVDLSGGTDTNRWSLGRRLSVTNAQSFERGQRVFALLAEGTNGFARVSGLSPERPAAQDYIRARVAWASGGDVNLELPFDRYYMNEKRAPAAEQAYREHSRRGTNDACVVVRVRDGSAVLERLLIGDRPIESFLKEQGGVGGRP